MSEVPGISAAALAYALALQDDIDSPSKDTFIHSRYDYPPTEHTSIQNYPSKGVVHLPVHCVQTENRQVSTEQFVGIVRVAKATANMHRPQKEHTWVHNTSALDWLCEVCIP